MPYKPEGGIRILLDMIYNTDINSVWDEHVFISALKDIFLIFFSSVNSVFKNLGSLYVRMNVPRSPETSKP